MVRLFVSHATADRKFVESELLGLLRALGFDPWFAESDIQTSEQWERMILGALRSSKWFVLVMSPKSAVSEWVKDELAWAIEEASEYIIPILIDDCNPRDFHIRLPRIQYLDFRQNLKEAREQLIRLLVDKEYKPFVQGIGTSDPLKRKLRSFWLPFFEGGLQIVLGRFREFAAFEQSGLLGVGDAVAMTELRAGLESVGLLGVPISYADRLDGDALKTNLVLLGGPDANLLTREVARRIQSTLKFGDPDRHVIALFDSVDQRQFVPRRSPPDTIENVFGIVFSCNNPFASHKRVILGAGSFGYGTWACVRFLLSEGFLDHPLSVERAEAEFLIEAEVLWETPQRVRLHVARPLTNGT
jgi:hypothetical protein